MQWQLQMLVGVLCLAGLSLATVSAQLLVEHFDYPGGRLGDPGIGNTVWTGGDSPSTALIVTNTAALTYPGLADCTGAGLLMSGSTFKKKAAPFAAQSGIGTSVYCSFLLNILTQGSLAKLILYLQNGNSASSSPPLGVFLNGDVLGIAKSASAPQVTTGSIGGGTHLVVVRYTFLAGNDQVDLWLDPVQFGDNNNVPPPTLSAGTTSSSDAAALSYVFLNHGVAQTVWIDELRVGTNWADVTPSVPKPLALRLEQPIIEDTGLRLLITGGAPRRQFELLASPDLLVPAEEWNVITVDELDETGSIELSVPYPTAHAMFYRVRLPATPRPVAPTIITQPSDLIVTSSQTAVFSVVAKGTPPLFYQWFFQAEPTRGATNSTYAITNAQPEHSGAYHVVVTNAVGAVTSRVATLIVSNVQVAPFIVTQPAGATVVEGQTVVLSVIAAGTTPLYYQWYFNTNQPIPGATNASLVLESVTTNHAGWYSVVVSNAYGTVTSAFAQLTVLPWFMSQVDFGHVGFASLGFELTGGAGWPVVVVSNTTALMQYTDANGPYTIYVLGTIPVSGMATHVRPNKTIIGIGTNATLVGGGLYLYRSTNVIIRNLTIMNSTEDGIGLHYSSNVWIDHCTVIDAADGLIDITQQSDLVTISWCKFYYTGNYGHNYCNLIASSDSDTGNYRITFHHNWWDAYCVERMPSVRFGRAHIFNNYYNAPGNNYCVRSRLYAECRIENNWFENVRNPWEVYITTGTPGKVYAHGNMFTNVTWYESPADGRYVVPGTDTVFTPPYSYTLHPVELVPELVRTHAGAGRGPFAP